MRLSSALNEHAVPKVSTTSLCISQSSGAFCRFALGLAYIKKGQVSKAQELLEQALKLNPNSAAIRCAIGQVRLMSFFLATDVRNEWKLATGVDMVPRCPAARSEILFG